MLSSRFQRFTNYKNIYLLDTLEGLVMSPPHFRFYDEAPGTNLEKKQLCQFLWFQCSTATCTGVQKTEPKVQQYSQRRQTGRNGRAVGMTQDPSGANPFSGGQSRQQFDKAIVFQRSC